MLTTYLLAAAGLASWTPPNIPAANTTAWSLQNVNWDGATLWPKLDFTGINRSNLQSHTWNTNGTQLFLVCQITGSSTTVVQEILLSTGYALATATTGQSFNTGFTGGYGIAFGSNGTKMYITRKNAAGSVNEIYQYSLSTGFDLSTVSLVRSRDLSAAPFNPAQISELNGLKISPDDTKFIFASTNSYRSSAILTYTATSPGEVDSLFWDGRDTWDRIAFDTTSAYSSTATLSGSNISDDGLRLYVSFTNGDNKLLALSAAHRIGEIGSVSSFNSSDTSGTIQNSFVNSDGTRLYTTNTTRNRIYQFNIANPNDLSTASYSGKELFVGAGTSYNETQLTGISLSADGRYLYFVGKSAGYVYQLEMSSNWELDTATFVGQSTFARLAVTTELARAVSFSSDGVYFYISLYSSIRQFQCTSPWVLWNAALIYTYTPDIGSGLTEIRFSDDGHYMYLLRNNATIYQFNLSQPWQLSSAANSGNRYVVPSGIDSGINSFDIGNYGYYLYVYGTSKGRISMIYLTNPYQLTVGISYGYKFMSSYTIKSIQIEYDRIFTFSTGSSFQEWILTTPWDVLSASTANRRTVSVLGYPDSSYTTSGMYVSDGGEYLFHLHQNGYLNKLFFGSPYNASTIGKFSAGSGTFYHSGTRYSLALGFSRDGQYFYSSNEGSTTYTYTYRCSTPWLVSTAAYLAFDFLSSARTFAFGNNGGYIYHYLAYRELVRRNLSTPYILSTKSNFSSTPGTQIGWAKTTGGYKDLAFAPSGTKYFELVQSNNNYVYDRTTPVAFGFNASGYSTSYYNLTPTIPNSGALVNGISMPTARRLFVNTSSVLSLTTLNADYTLIGSTRPSISQGTGYFRFSSTWKMRLHPSGTKLFGITNTSMGFREYTINTAWQIGTSSSSVTGSYLYSTALNTNGFCLNNDGTKFYAINDSSVYEFNAASAYTVSGMTYIRRNTTIGGEALAFSTDGSRMFVLTSNFRIRVYNLTTVYNVATAVLEDTYTLPTGGFSIGSSFTRDLIWRSDGKKLFLALTNNNRPYLIEYSCALNWTVVTVSWIRTWDQYSPSHDNRNAYSLDIRPDGQKLYMMGDNQTVYQYTLYVPT